MRTFLSLMTHVIPLFRWELHYVFLIYILYHP